MYRGIGALLLTLGLAAPALAQGGLGAAEELLRKCGMWEQLASVEPQVQAGILQGMSSRGMAPSAPEAQRIAKAAAVAFAAPRLRSAAARVVSTGLAPGHIDSLQAWYGSAAGQAMTRLEEQAAASQGDPQAVLRDGSVALEQSTPQRRTLLQSLARETRVVDAAVEMTVNAAVAVQRGVAAASPGAPAPSAAEIRAGLNQQRPRLVATYTSLVMASFALTYRAASDAELERYVEFVRSPAGQHFNALAIRALDAALSGAGEDFGRLLPATRARANTHETA